MKFVSTPSTHYKVVIEQQSALWCITITAPGRTHIRFSNVYSSADAALGEAEVLAVLVLTDWGIVLDGPIQWERGYFTAAG